MCREFVAGFLQVNKRARRAPAGFVKNFTSVGDTATNVLLQIGTAALTVVQSGDAFQTKDRRAEKKPSPSREDRGLFKREIVAIAAQLTPIISHTGRHDVVILGFSGGSKQFDVVIAGRRSVMAAPLVAHLAAIKTAYVKQVRGRAISDEDLFALRVAVGCEGAWRTRVWVDDAGWQSRRHQFLVARWRVGTDPDGQMYGAPFVGDA